MELTATQRRWVGSAQDSGAGAALEQTCNTYRLGQKTLGRW